MTDFRQRKFLVFSLGREEFGFFVHQVQSIEILGTLRNIPQSPDYICGVVDLRGSILPIVDLQYVLTKNKSEVSEGKRIIVLRTLKGLMGFTVDEPKEVIDVTEDMIQKTALFLNDTEKTVWFAKIGQRLINLLDIDEMLVECRLEGIVRMQDSSQVQAGMSYV